MSRIFFLVLFDDSFFFGFKFNLFFLVCVFFFGYLISILFLSIWLNLNFLRKLQSDDIQLKQIISFHFISFKLENLIIYLFIFYACLSFPLFSHLSEIQSTQHQILYTHRDTHAHIQVNFIIVLPYKNIKSSIQTPL